MADAKIPVLDADKDDFDMFARMLATWCAGWVPEVGVPIMRKANELYEDAAVRVLVDKWYSAYSCDRKDTVDRLMRAASGDELAFESDGGEFEFNNSTWHRTRGCYSESLYALLVK